MAYNVRLTKKGSVFLAVVGFLLLGAGLAFTVVYLGNRDNQIGTGDSDASGICCNGGNVTTDGNLDRMQTIKVVHVINVILLLVLNTVESHLEERSVRHLHVVL